MRGMTSGGLLGCKLEMHMTFENRLSAIDTQKVKSNVTKYQLCTHTDRS